MSDQRFSDITLAYNEHIAALDRARRIFEEDARRLNQFVLDHIEIHPPPADTMLPKVRWSDVEDYSGKRQVTWLNYYTAIRLSLDLRQPGKQRFKRGAAYMYFETVFDHDLLRFVFQCRLENQNLVHSELDEEIMRIVRERGKDVFPKPIMIKSNIAVLFRRELANELYENLSQYVDDVGGAIAAAVDQIFPDSEYAAEAEEESVDDSVPRPFDSPAGTSATPMGAGSGEQQH